MKLVPTEHIPGRCAKHDLQKLIEEFINGEAKVVNVDFNEHDYKSSKSCAGCFHSSVVYWPTVCPVIMLVSTTEYILTWSAD